MPGSTTTRHTYTHEHTHHHQYCAFQHSRQARITHTHPRGDWRQVLPSPMPPRRRVADPLPEQALCKRPGWVPRPPTPEPPGSGGAREGIVHHSKLPCHLSSCEHCQYSFTLPVSPSPPLVFLFLPSLFPPFCCSIFHRSPHPANSTQQR